MNTWETFVKTLTSAYDAHGVPFIQTITVPSINAKMLNLAGISIGEDGLYMPPVMKARISGLNFDGGTMSAGAIKLVSGNGTIDMGGCSITNVSGINTDPDLYTIVAKDKVSASNSNVLLANIILTDNSIFILSYEYIASRANGISIAGEGRFKINSIGGIIAVQRIGERNEYADDSTVSSASVSVIPLANSINIMGSGVPTYTLKWVCTITLLRQVFA